MGNDIRSEAMRAFFSVTENSVFVQQETDQQETDCVKQKRA